MAAFAGGFGFGAQPQQPGAFGGMQAFQAQGQGQQQQQQQPGAFGVGQAFQAQGQVPQPGAFGGGNAFQAQGQQQQPQQPGAFGGGLAFQQQGQQPQQPQQQPAFGGGVAFQAQPQGQQQPAFGAVGAFQVQAPAQGQQQQQQQQQQAPAFAFGPAAGAAPAQVQFGFPNPVGAGGAFAPPANMFPGPGVPAAPKAGQGGGNIKEDMQYDHPTLSNTSLKAKLKATSVSFVKPMNEKLKKLESTTFASNHDPERQRAALSKIKVAMIKLCARQEQMLSEAKRFKDQTQRQCDDARRYGLEKIKEEGNGHGRGRLQQTRLPNPFFQGALDNMDQRLQSVALEIDEFRQLLEISYSTVESERMGGAGYGQRVKIGAQQLVQVIQRQHEAYLRIAASVAELHRGVDELRKQFMDLDFARHAPNPFDADDAERKEERELEKRRQVQEEEDHQNEKDRKQADLAAAQGPAFGGVGMAPALAFPALPAGAPAAAGAAPGLAQFQFGPAAAAQNLKGVGDIMVAGKPGAKGKNR